MITAATLTSEIQMTQPSKRNADGNLDGLVGNVYFGMNGGNVSKNIINAGAATATLTGSAKVAAIISLPATCLTLLIGFFYVGTGIPGIKEAYNNATSATEARALEEEELTKPVSEIPNQHSLTSTEKVSQVALRKIKEFLAWTGVFNWSLYIGVGITQMGLGIVTLLGPDTAALLHTTAILTGHVFKVAISTFLTGIGVIYIARGFTMLYRSSYGIQHAKDLRKGLETTVNSTDFKTLSLEDKKNKIIHFLKVNCALNGEKTKDIYTSLDKYNFSEIATEEDLNQYIQALDEAFNDELSRQQVARTIGASMVLGGILTLIAAYLSGGTSILIVALISSVIFTVMEGSFLLFDSSTHFESYVHKNYEQPEYLKRKRTKIYGLDAERFKQYQTDLYWFKSRAPQSNAQASNEGTEHESLLCKANPTEKQELSWSELAWSPLYPLILYNKYKSQDLIPIET